MKIFISTPMHDKPTAHYAVSMARFLIEASRRFDIIYDPPLQVSNLAESRNIALGHAISHSADKILFVDDDMLFRPDDAFRLLSHEGPVVSGVYKKKLKAGIHVGYTLEDVGWEAKTSPEGLLGMACVGMGFCAVDVPFVKKLWEKYPDRTFKKEGVESPCFFEFKLDVDLAGQKRVLGEDETFCKWVILYGQGDVWIDTEVKLGHVGSYVY